MLGGQGERYDPTLQSVHSVVEEAINKLIGRMSAVVKEWKLDGVEIRESFPRRKT